MNTQRPLISIGSVFALCAMAGLARADGGEYALPEVRFYPEPATQVASLVNVAEREQPVMCAEATQAAWFMNELQRTDGHAQPSEPIPVACAESRAILASTDVYEESK